jgi:hypothetical protein
MQFRIFHRLISPLLFCFSLIPLTEQLNKLNTGYEDHTAKTKISHLLYIDDLELIKGTAPKTDANS